ncbi:Twitching mobility protein [Planctomycetes bacterium Pla163]|uniref:Twitching mobility protein n=1 Tax=Rohdeia mirabilis TaxID=2528008 RepID=A0A518D2Q5_9BACT|nr:Twitching mobility protein [Planctomycetes bacterium Pla163]
MQADHSHGGDFARRPIRFDAPSAAEPVPESSASGGAQRLADDPSSADQFPRPALGSEPEPALPGAPQPGSPYGDDDTDRRASATELMGEARDDAVLDGERTDAATTDAPDSNASGAADNELLVADPYAMHIGTPPVEVADETPRLSPRHQLEQWLDIMVRREASDLILRSGGRPACRVDGRIVQLDGTVPHAGPMREVLEGILGPKRYEEYLENGAADAALQLDGVGRFRINAYRQLGEPAIVLRRISDEPPRLTDLCLPTTQLKELAMRKRGIMLVTGVAGSGKSTTLSGMIQYLNENAERHVITLEDPVEMLFKEKRCVISQREVGTDVPNFHQGLRHALRQSPDVILIGEMRDAETVRAAIDATETGHFVMSTLHTVNAAQTIERIVGFFPPQQHAQVRARLGDTISAVLSQRLIPSATGEGMVPAIELMQATPYVRELIAEGRIADLANAVEQGSEDGMLSFNGSLLRLIEAGMVEIGAAMAASDKPDELMLALRGFQSRGRGSGTQLKMG